MNCRSCGTSLSPGIAYCPNCGSPTPYNSTGQGASSPYDQTVASSSYDPNTPPSNPQPYTGYGAPPPSGSYTYPPPPQDPYNSMPSTPYGNTGGNSAPGTYPSTPASYNNYGGAPTPYPGAGQPGPYGMVPQQKKSSKVGLILGITALVVVLGCGGIIAATALFSRGSTTTTTGTTPTVAPTQAATQSTQGDVPSKSDIVPAAATIIFNVKMASAIDSNYHPTVVTDKFKTKATVYATFKVNSKDDDGYIRAKWYQNGIELTRDILQHSAKNDHGYFSLPYDDPGDGAIAMYWCLKSDCSDEQLAQITTFTVSDTAFVPANTISSALPIDRRRSA